VTPAIFGPEKHLEPKPISPPAIFGTENVFSSEQFFMTSFAFSGKFNENIQMLSGLLQHNP
jgi:hypothetical protein